MLIGEFRLCKITDALVFIYIQLRRS